MQETVNTFLMKRYWAISCVQEAVSNYQTIRWLDSTYRKIANSFDLLEKWNAIEYACCHDKEGATGKGGCRGYIFVIHWATSGHTFNILNILYSDMCKQGDEFNRCSHSCLCVSTLMYLTSLNHSGWTWQCQQATLNLLSNVRMCSFVWLSKRNGFELSNSVDWKWRNIRLKA